MARLLPPESTALEEVSREVGIGVDTLQRWRSEALAQPAGDRGWTAAARFKAVLTTAAMDEAGKSVCDAAAQRMAMMAGKLLMLDILIAGVRYRVKAETAKFS